MNLTVDVIKIEPHFITFYSVNMQPKETSLHIRLQKVLVVGGVIFTICMLLVESGTR